MSRRNTALPPSPTALWAVGTFPEERFRVPLLKEPSSRSLMDSHQTGAHLS